jgi:hypothetical protein
MDPERERRIGGDPSERPVQQPRGAARSVVDRPRQVGRPPEAAIVEQAPPAPDGDHRGQAERQGRERDAPQSQQPLGAEPRRDRAGHGAEHARQERGSERQPARQRGRGEQARAPRPAAPPAGQVEHHHQRQKRQLPEQRPGPKVPRTKMNIMDRHDRSPGKQGECQGHHHRLSPALVDSIASGW